MSLPDKATLTGTYGGPYVQARSVEQPQQEVGDAALNQALNDIAMATHTLQRAWVRFAGLTLSGGPPDAITVVDHDALWGSGTGVKPTVSHTAAGVYVITWATTQLDELGVSHTLSIKKPKAWALSGDRSDARVVSFTANAITINTLNDAGSANALNGVTIFVEWT